MISWGMHVLKECGDGVWPEEKVIYLAYLLMSRSKEQEVGAKEAQIMEEVVTYVRHSCTLEEGVMMKMIN